MVNHSSMALWARLPRTRARPSPWRIGVWGNGFRRAVDRRAGTEWDHRGPGDERGHDVLFVVRRGYGDGRRGGPSDDGFEVDGQRRADFDSVGVGLSQGVEDVGEPAFAAKLAVLATGIVHR